MTSEGDFYPEGSTSVGSHSNANMGNISKTLEHQLLLKQLKSRKLLFSLPFPHKSSLRVGWGGLFTHLLLFLLEDLASSLLSDKQRWILLTNSFSKRLKRAVSNQFSHNVQFGSHSQSFAWEEPESNIHVKHIHLGSRQHCFMYS